METIIRYKAFDGTIFDVSGDCVKYEEFLYEIREIIKPLIDVPKSVKSLFEMGGGYIKQSEFEVKDMIVSLLKLSKKYEIISTDEYNRFKAQKHLNFNELLTSHSNPKWYVLYTVWLRISCIDDDYREWCKPVFKSEKSDRILNKLA